MNEVSKGKMYTMRTIVVNQYQEKDTKKRLCLPEVHYKNIICKLLKKASRALIFGIIKAVVSFIPAYMAYLWLIPAVYAERGYYAVGGEWILIFSVFVGFYYLFSVAIENEIEKAREKERRIRNNGRKNKMSEMS